MPDIFSQEEVKQTPVEAPSQTQPATQSLYEDLLKGIVNESGQPKYQSVDVALQALKASQEYIPQLKQKETALEAEVRQLKEELAKRSSVEEVVERLKAQQQPVLQDTPVHTGLDENAVLGILAKRDAEAVALANIKNVSDQLTAKYGDKAKDVLQQKVTELGISPQALKDLSAQSPAAVMALFGNSGIKSTSPVSNSFNLPMEKKEEVIERPAKSLLIGASTQDQIEFMRKIKAKVYADYGITE